MSGRGSRGSSPRRPRQKTNVVIVTPQQQRRPGLFGQMAATAAGVTVGSAVGTAVGNALVGGHHRREDLYELPRDYRVGDEPSGPCAFEIKQFLKCAEINDDLASCQEFSKALKMCKEKNGLL